MPVFDRLQIMSFGGKKFPFGTYSIQGGLRDHVHEYPHSDGGAPEKLGRKLYEFQVEAMFLGADDMTPAARARYGTLFPETKVALFDMFEAGLTDALVIPSLGSIQAYAISWREKATAKLRSGVELDLTFREDAASVSLLEILKSGPTGLPDKLNTFDTVRAQLYGDQPQPGLFDKISALANQVIGIKDQAALYTSLIASKVEGLAALLALADSTISDLNNPDNTELMSALHDLWQSTLQLKSDLLQKNGGIQLYTTPLLMGVAAISTAIYGTPDRAVELMQMNAFNDPLAVPANTKVIYYAAS